MTAMSARLHGLCTGKEDADWCPCCCAGCLESCVLHEPDHGLCQTASRWWFYPPRAFEWPWWKLFLRGSDEFCNRTVVLRLPFTPVVVRTRKVRTESCEVCVGEVVELAQRLAGDRDKEEEKEK